MKSFQDKGPAPSTDEWIKKMWYINTMEYYPGIKRNEIMSFAAAWMDLASLNPYPKPYPNPHPHTNTNPKLPLTASASNRFPKH